jgi:hypothetical protein
MERKNKEGTWRGGGRKEEKRGRKERTYSPRAQPLSGIKLTSLLVRPTRDRVEKNKGEQKKERRKVEEGGGRREEGGGRREEGGRRKDEGEEGRRKERTYSPRAQPLSLVSCSRANPS